MTTRNKTPTAETTKKSPKILHERSGRKQLIYIEIVIYPLATTKNQFSAIG